MTTCVDTLGPGPENILCPTNHCDSLQETTAFHNVCDCLDWQGNPIPNCDPKGSLYPVQTVECFNEKTEVWKDVNNQQCRNEGPEWFMKTCYCCCTCLASNTPVADPGGFKAIGDYEVGDSVLAASRAGDSWSWDPQTVAFSSGTPATTYKEPTAGNISIYLEYGDGQTLIATPNQLFALPDGKLKRADQLVPDSDELAGADGEAVPITRLATGYFKGALHHIATSMVSYEEFDGSIDGHLINANGVVCGDYLLQLYQDTEKMKPHLESEAPVIGTYAYREANPELYVKPYAVGASEEVVGSEVSVPDFVVHGEAASDVPATATALFTKRQVALLLDPSIPKRGFSDKTNVQQFEWFATVYGAFSPQVTITLDWESTSPNVYAWEAEGQRNVFVGGELLRLGPLYGPAMAIAIGFGVAAATSDGGRVGRALYDGIAVSMLEALGNFWAQTATPGQEQFENLLTALGKLEQGPAPVEDGLRAECLTEVITAATSGEELPPCGGGPRPTLQLAKASYADGILRAVFNEALDSKTATQADHYALAPSGEIASVGLNVRNPSAVRIETELEPGQYVLTANDVRGLDGSTLDPKARSVKFKVKAG
jgi:hypothetical protein